jgi:hypothetical protein
MAFVASTLPISTILHLLGACWAYSVIGVPRFGDEVVGDEVDHKDISLFWLCCKLQ